MSPARGWLRTGLGFLAAGDIAIGAWAYLAPGSFFDDVPTVSTLPPFNAHLVSDVGAFFISQGVVLAAAAVIMQRRLTAIALCGYLSFAVLHLIYHYRHLAGMADREATGLVVALALSIVVPAALLIMNSLVRSPVES